MRFLFLNFVVSPLYFLPQIYDLRFQNLYLCLKRDIFLFHRVKFGLVSRSARNLFEKVSDPAHETFTPK